MNFNFRLNYGWRYNFRQKFEFPKITTFQIFYWYSSHILLILHVQFVQITTRPTYSVGFQTQLMRQKNVQLVYSE